MSYSNFNVFKLFQNVIINSSGDYMVSMKPDDNNVSFHSSNSIDYNNVDIMSIKNIINKKQNEDLNLSSLTGTTINPVITINNNNQDCRIMTNLNVAGNVNITKNLDVSNTIVSHNLIIPTQNNSNLLSNVQGSIYFNKTQNMYEGYVGDNEGQGWQPLGGFSKTKDATIHKNLNVIGNINLTNGGLIKTTGIGSFGSINCGVGTFTSLDSGNGLIKTTGIGSFGSVNCGVGTFTSLDSGSGLIKTTGIGSFGSISGVGTFTSIDSAIITSTNTNNAIVRRDSLKNFSAGTMYGTADFANQVLMTSDAPIIPAIFIFANGTSSSSPLYGSNSLQYNPSTSRLTTGTIHCTTGYSVFGGHVGVYENPMPCIL